VGAEQSQEAPELVSGPVRAPVGVFVQPLGDRLVQEEGECAVYEGIRVVVGVELGAAGVEVLRDAPRQLDFVADDREEALVGVKVLALVPVDVVEPQIGRESDDGEEQQRRQRVLAEPRR
jgi:hypothetical protein